TVAVVRDTLAEIDPDGASTYEENARRYIENLMRLDEYAERVLNSVPESQRLLVTAHDAFNYFGSRYGYEVVGIQGISTESEAGVRDIERLVELLVGREVGAVFVESTVSDRNVKALIAGAKARGHTVIIGGELLSDAMGDPGTYTGTYVGMIDHNVTTIARALGGEAPADGLNGELEVSGE
ncbi:MAG: zinc ABC transporter substrate-binding protein, partial [Planctomycetota bacterium]